MQTNEWTSTSQGDLSTDFLLDSDGETGFDKEANELEREMFGLRLAIEKGGDQTGASEPDLKNDDDEDGLHVEKMDGLMLRMQAIKGEDILVHSMYWKWKRGKSAILLFIFLRLNSALWT